MATPKELPEQLPPWLEKAYNALLEAFQERSFRFPEAARVLEAERELPEDQTMAVLSELRRRGWLEVRPDPEDRRRRIYRLVLPHEPLQTYLVRTARRSLSRAELEGLLKQAADLIRTRVDYTFILVLLFYKRISDRWKREYREAYEEAVREGFTPYEAAEEAKDEAYHDFVIPEEYLWDRLREDPAHLPENLSRAFRIIGERNPELRSVFENVDFLQFTQSQENAEILRQLFELFSAYSLDDVSPDLLGDAYEWILRYFAPQKAKEGEVYTPREVIRLMVRMLDPRPGERVYDPACGSGGMLILAYQELEAREGRDAADRLFLFGQEQNFKTLALARMNLYIHDIRNGDLRQGDTLLYPKFVEGDRLMRFQVILSNPPWNQDGYDEQAVKRGSFWRERFRYGFTTRQSADWLWIQHMLASGDPEAGRIAVVIDNGALFRSGREKKIRRAVLEDDLLEAVLLLPEKLFYNTGAPGAILVFRMQKPPERKGKVLFINASREYEPHPTVRKLNRLGEAHIRKIVQAYHAFAEEEGFARVVSLKEIEENDWNLNVTLYVYPVEEEEPVDIPAEWRALAQIRREKRELDEKIRGFLEELGYELSGS